MAEMYKNGKIYKIECDKLVYYGSTCSTLTKRMSAHKIKSNVCSSCILFEKGNPSITLVEDFPCERKEQLLARERYYIENNECINKYVPCRTREEFFAKHPEKRIETCKKYYENNKEHYKEYRENTKQEKATYDKEYNKVNKEAIGEKRNVKCTCECGGKFTIKHKSAHAKTQVHLDFMNKISTI